MAAAASAKDIYYSNMEEVCWEHLFPWSVYLLSMTVDLRGPNFILLNVSLLLEIRFYVIGWPENHCVVKAALNV